MVRINTTLMTPAAPQGDPEKSNYCYVYRSVLEKGYMKTKALNKTCGNQAMTQVAAGSRSGVCLSALKKTPPGVERIAS